MAMLWAGHKRNFPYKLFYSSIHLFADCLCRLQFTLFRFTTLYSYAAVDCFKPLIYFPIALVLW